MWCFGNRLRVLYFQTTSYIRFFKKRDYQRGLFSSFQQHRIKWNRYATPYLVIAISPVFIIPVAPLFSKSCGKTLPTMLIYIARILAWLEKREAKIFMYTIHLRT